MPVTTHPVYSRQAASHLLPGLVSPFTWSILGQAAERAVRSAYASLGHGLPAAHPIWRRHLGRAYVNRPALEIAELALFRATEESSSLGQRLLGGGPSRQQGAAMRQVLEEAPGQFDAIERWWQTVNAMEWRQATILQIMEEIEPRAQAVLTTCMKLELGLRANRQLLAGWLPAGPGTLQAELFAGLDGDPGSAGYRLALAGLAQEEHQGPATAALDWREAWPDGEFGQLLRSFVERYGRWGPVPLEAASPRWREAPGELFAHLASLDAGSRDALAPGPEGAVQRRSAAAAEASRRLGLLRRRQFKALFEQLQRQAALLEDCRGTLVTVVDAARYWALGAAGEATADGRLASTDQVFLLELEELKQMMTGEWSSPEQVRPIVLARGEQQAKWQAQQPPAEFQGE